MARLAADPWLRGVAVNARTEFQSLLAACKRLASDEDIVGLGEKAYPQFLLFPYEGAVAYENRHDELAEELSNYAGDSPEERRRAVHKVLS
ncbi:MAG TPA: hypothetical protein VJY33_01185, partial [Isosphaeraceae bacterium]|nr:hypothetical protein [Isosphaeraceae bacterium]